MQTGWIPSTPDERDWSWPFAPHDSSSIDLEPPFAVRDQGDVPCCVSCAVVTAMEILSSANDDPRPLSVLYNYYRARSSIGTLEEISIRSGLRAANRFGVCREAAHPASAGLRGPYTRADALREPSWDADSDASRRLLVDVDPSWNTLGYYRLSTIGRAAEWLSVLGRGAPIVFGFSTVGRYREIVAGTTAEIIDAEGDGSGIGHVAVVVGYDAPWFVVRDSQGTGFARHGHWVVHRDAVDGTWVAESWAVAAIENE